MTRTSDPLDALLAHNRWATRLIIDKCRALTPEQFTRPFPIGPGDHGGLHAILTHVIGAMRRWADRIAARDIRPSIETWRPGYTPRDPYTPDELLALLEDAHADLAGAITAARQRPLDREVVIYKSHTCTAGAAISGAAVHGHYHRAQCMNILRRLGVLLADVSLDVIDWQEAEERL
jgi:uncharacterized damage-inducible protein DinB